MPAIKINRQISATLSLTTPQRPLANICRCWVMAARVDEEVQSAVGNYHQLVCWFFAISHQRLGREEESLCLEHQLRRAREGRRDKREEGEGGDGKKRGAQGGSGEGWNR